MLGHSLIERFYNPFMALDEIIIAACYIVYQAKKWVDGCGGNTDLMVLTDEYRIGMSSDDIKVIEGFFEEYDKWIDNCLTAMANPRGTITDAARTIQAARQRLLKCRKKLTKHDSLKEFFDRIETQKKALPAVTP